MAAAMPADATGVHSAATSAEASSSTPVMPSKESTATAKPDASRATKKIGITESPDVFSIDTQERKQDWAGLLKFLNDEACYSDCSHPIRVPTLLAMHHQDAPRRHRKLWYCIRRLYAVCMQPRPVKDLDSAEPLAVWRTQVGKWVLSPPVQICVMVAILTDILAMMYKVSVDPESTIGFSAGSESDVWSEAQLTAFLVIDWIVCIVLGIEVFCRVFYWGQKFSHLWLNILEFSLVPVMLVELLTRDEDVNIGVPVPLLRTLRPFIRCVNLIAKAARGFTHAVKLGNELKERVTGTHKRYIGDGFNLDLCYINPQLIAMGRPATGGDALFNNPLSEVVRFFNTKHQDKFIIINTSEHLTYRWFHFNHRVIWFPIAEHSVPRLVDLNELCAAMKTFLDADEDHVIAVHGQAGGGQIGIVIAAYLLYCGAFRQAISAMSNYERTRTAPGAPETVQGFDSASQRRFVENFCSCVHELHCVPCENTPDPPIRAKLLSIRLLGVDFEALGGVNVRIFLRKQRTKSRKGAEDGSDEKEDLEKEEEDASSRGNEDEALTLMMQEEMALMELAEAEKNKHQPDALKSGCHPQPGMCYLDTTENSEYTCKGKVLMQQGDDPLDSGNILAWRFEDVELAGEVCFEVHAKPPPRRVNKKNPRMSTAGAKMRKLRTKVLSRKKLSEDNNNNTKGNSLQLPFDKSDDDGSKSNALDIGRSPKSMPLSSRYDDVGRSYDTSIMGSPSDSQETKMLFCAWFHTSFLEANQSMSLRRELGDQSIGITLGRFNVDKAADASSLQSYGASFQMQIMFEVEESLDTRPRRTKQPQGFETEGRDELTRLHPPDSETDVSEVCEIGWLTWFVNKLWPYTEVALVRLIRDVVEPLLQDAMPGPFKSIHFAAFTLGKDTPELGPVVASHRSGGSNGLQLDLAIKYRGDVNILMATGVAEIGINQVLLSGTLSILLDPIIEQLPIVGGMKLFFLNPPKVKLQFVGLAALGTSIPGMEKRVETTIQDALAGSLVLPYVLSIDWRPEIWQFGDPTVELASRLPLGVLRVVIMEAKGLAVENQNRLYAAINFGATKLKTPMSKKSAYHEIRWDETSDLLYYDPQQILVIEVFTKEGLSKSDRLVGQTQPMMIETLMNAGGGQQWVILDGASSSWSKNKSAKRQSKFFSGQRSSNTDTTGRILLSVELKELIADASRLPKAEEKHGPQRSEKATEDHAALLICNVMKARVPQDRVHDCKMCVRVGDVEVERKCTPADETWKSFVDLTRDSTVNAIEVLVREGFTSERIAHVLKKPEPLVNKVMAHCLGYNVGCAQHMCVFVRPKNLHGGHIEFDIKRKARIEASARLSMESVIESPSMRLRKYVKLSTGPQGGGTFSRTKLKGEGAPQNTSHRYDVDLELQLFVFSKTKGAEEAPEDPVAQSGVSENVRDSRSGQVSPRTTPRQIPSISSL